MDFMNELAQVVVNLVEYQMKYTIQMIACQGTCEYFNLNDSFPLEKAVEIQ